jgi:hypothetical protein
VRPGRPPNCPVPFFFVFVFLTSLLLLPFFLFFTFLFFDNLPKPNGETAQIDASVAVWGREQGREGGS